MPILFFVTAFLFLFGVFFAYLDVTNVFSMSRLINAAELRNLREDVGELWKTWSMLVRSKS